MPGATDLNASQPDTERQDLRFGDIDKLSVADLVQLMNQTDSEVPQAIAKSSPAIASAIEQISQQYQLGGRVIYVGAGTSGRIATLDASEIYPTFGVSGRFVALMAGGRDALVDPKEGAEDDAEASRVGLKALGLTSLDVLVGVASSGSTPYVLSALEYANEMGAVTVAISCNPNSKMSELAQYPIEVVVGPELLTGSTRLKAGTAQKLILNMISTITMVKAGKTHGNWMVDVVASNTKLKNRAVGMLCAITGIDPELSRKILEEHDWKVKSAVIGAELGLDPLAAVELLRANNDILARALGEEA